MRSWPVLFCGFCSCNGINNAATELEEDACTQGDWNWHGVRENLFHMVNAKQPPYWNPSKARQVSELLSFVPKARHGWWEIEKSPCPMGEAALLLAEFLSLEDQAYLEMALLLMHKTLALCLGSMVQVLA